MVDLRGWPLKERLYYRSKPGPGSCTSFTGCKTRGGYGQIRVGKKMRSTHVVALEFKLGRPLKEGLQCNHTCDNSACVNPDHLYEGTQKQNVRDRVVRKRSAHLKGALNGTAKMTRRKVTAVERAVGKQRDIASRFGISQSHVSRIKRRETGWQS